jgi:hypothetical protein
MKARVHGSMLALLALGCTITAGCDGERDPSVAIVEVTPGTLAPEDDGKDDLLIRVEYHDPDGDLGGGVAEIHDCRAEGLITAYDIPPIASDEAVDEGVPITGMLDLHVNDIGAVPISDDLPELCADLDVDPLESGHAVFCVTLTDAAGHAGRGDCTDSIPVGTP